MFRLPFGGHGIPWKRLKIGPQYSTVIFGYQSKNFKHSRYVGRFLVVYFEAPCLEVDSATAPDGLTWPRVLSPDPPRVVDPLYKYKGVVLGQRSGPTLQI